MVRTQAAILQRWTYLAADTAARQILPDGCRDLIHWAVPGLKPQWLLSHLQDETMTVSIPKGACLVGYRLVPGAEFPRNAAAELMRDRSDDPDHVIARFTDAVRRDRRTFEALCAVAKLSFGVNEAAVELGVSRRSLERVLMRHTGRPPVFWSQLARVRASARTLVSGVNLVEAAYQVGYSDQAHMSRAVRRWFGVSPSELTQREDLSEQLFAPGYDADTGEHISTR